MKASPHIVFAESFDGSAIERARQAGRVTVLDACDELALRNALHDADALLVRSSARVTQSVIENAERLRVIGRAGVGLENIDVNVAHARGIRVVYTPYAATDAVADLTVGILLSLVRGIFAGHGAVKDGRFTEFRRGASGRELGEMTLGIVGFGRIGQAVAHRCHRGFGTRILYNDIVTPEPVDFPAESMSKGDLYSASDVVSLHVPLTSDTLHLIDTDALNRFKPGAILLNTARGKVVDSAAVAQALHDGKLGGAGLDVLDEEPPPPDHPLLHTPSTIVTPHIGARTKRGLARMNGVIEDVIRVLDGKEPLYEV